MKITADNLLGSAKRINSQRESSQSSKGKNETERADRADIARRADARLESVTDELRTLQTQLSEKQAVKEGLGRTSEAVEKGIDPKLILNEVQYNGKKVLLDFLGSNGDDLTIQLLGTKNKELDALIAQDTQKLSRLTIESENILASSLADKGKAGAILSQLNGMIADDKSRSEISSLNPEVVMRLIR